MTTKNLALTMRLQFVRIRLLPGHRFHTLHFPPLIVGLTYDTLITDKTYNSNTIIAELNTHNTKIIISQHPHHTKPLNIDTTIYTSRQLNENYYRKLKEYKHNTTHSHKTDQSYHTMIHQTTTI